MIGTHQFRFRPVGAGTALAPYYIVHIPHEQTTIFGITADCFCCRSRPGIDGVCTFPPPLPETFVRTRRRGEKNRDIGKRESDFTKHLHGINVYRHKTTKEYKFDFPQLPERAWQKPGGFSAKWYLSAFPDKEVNKGYGLVQNPGW